MLRNNRPMLTSNQGLGKFFVFAVLLFLGLFAVFKANQHTDHGHEHEILSEHEHDTELDTGEKAKRVAVLEAHASPRKGVVPKGSKDPKAQIDYTKITRICDQPRVFHYKGMLTPEEADYIVQLGGDKLERSMTVGPNGTGIVNPARTSYGYFFSREQKDEILVRTERKIEEWTHIPRENGEAFNILRYEVGQEYKPHHDFFSGFSFIEQQGNRIATVLTYLTDVEQGGQTIFPQPVCNGGEPIEVKPGKGDAILFWDANPNLTVDHSSLHGAKPVVKGVKWSLTKWLRSKRYRWL